MYIVIGLAVLAMIMALAHWFMRRRSRRRVSNDILKAPLLPIARYPCPYLSGFGINSGGVFVVWGPDLSEGNCCALTMENSPCSMWCRGEIPDWRHCSANDPNHKSYKRVYDKGICLPDEFKNPVTGSQLKMKIPDYMAYLLSDGCPKPDGPPPPPPDHVIIEVPHEE